MTYSSEESRIYCYETFNEARRRNQFSAHGTHVRNLEFNVPKSSMKLIATNLSSLFFSQKVKTYHGDSHAFPVLG